MNSKKRLAKIKQASLPRRADFAKGFLKDWQRLSRCGRYDMERLKKVMLFLIANDSPLGPEWFDHPLKGNWRAYRECHIGGDFLLIYLADETSIIFTRAGTHAELFDA